MYGISHWQPFYRSELHRHWTKNAVRKAEGRQEMNTRIRSISWKGKDYRQKTNLKDNNIKNEFPKFWFIISLFNLSYLMFIQVSQDRVIWFVIPWTALLLKHRRWESIYFIFESSFRLRKIRSKPRIIFSWLQRLWF